MSTIEHFEDYDVETIEVPVSFQLARPPLTRDELWDLVWMMWGVRIPRIQVCEHHCSPFDAFAEGFFGNTSNYALWYGARGTGKSLMLALLALTKAVTLEINVVLLGGSMAQSRNVHEHVENLLGFKIAPNYAVERQILTELKFTSNNWVRPIPASQTTVRGPHPHMLLLDEIDEMAKDIYDAAMGQAMAKPNTRGFMVPEMTIASSTWQNPIGTFQEVRDEALVKGSAIREWCIASDTLITTARGQVPIQEVTDQDLVLTRNGWRHVQHVTFMGHKPTITLYVGETELRATDDHLIATEDGWRTAGALATDTMSATRANPRVLGCELVPLTTVGSSPASEGPGTGRVDSTGYQVQVLDVDARSVATQVINSETVFDRPEHIEPDPSMGLHGGVRWIDGFDAVAVALRSRPVDAVSGEHGSTVLPVWDIGVEGDDHEFVANGIVVHNCYKEVLKTESNPHGWMDPAFIERKKASVPAEMFRVEYDMGEPAGGNRAFDIAKVAEYFVDVSPISERHVMNDDTWIFEEPELTGSYIAGADWAKEQDKTVIAVFRTDMSPHKMVYMRVVNRQSWPVMVKYFNDTIHRYHARSAHDRTGVGNVVNDLVDDRVLGVQMVDQKRKDLLNEYVSDFEQGYYRIPKCTSAWNAHKATTMAMIWGGAATAAHIPDEVVACAIANRARRAMPPPAGGFTVLKTDEAPKAFAGFNQEPVQETVVRRMDTYEDIAVGWVP